MNVGLNFFRRLYLNNKVNIWNVKATRCYISRNEYLEFAFPEPLHRDLPLVLCNVPVHHLDILLQLVRLHQTVCVCFCLSEYNCLALAAVIYQNVGEC